MHALLALFLAAAPDVCAVNLKTQLALPLQQFDQDPKRGWRPLADKKECLAAAAELIATYRTKNWKKFKEGEAGSLNWHEGQLRAALGQNELAAQLMAASVHADADPGSAAFLDYVLGSIAFVLRDKPGLLAARERLAKRPEPEAFAKEAAEIRAANDGNGPTWPLNLDVLDGFINCWNKPYQTAYQDLECRKLKTP